MLALRAGALMGAWPERSPQQNPESHSTVDSTVREVTAESESHTTVGEIDPEQEGTHSEK